MIKNISEVNLTLKLLIFCLHNTLCQSDEVLLNYNQNNEFKDLNDITNAALKHKAAMYETERLTNYGETSSKNKSEIISDFKEINDDIVIDTQKPFLSSTTSTKIINNDLSIDRKLSDEIKKAISVLARLDSGDLKRFFEVKQEYVTTRSPNILAKRTEEYGNTTNSIRRHLRLTTINTTEKDISFDDIKKEESKTNNKNNPYLLYLSMLHPEEQRKADDAPKYITDRRKFDVFENEDQSPLCTQDCEGKEILKPKYIGVPIRRLLPILRSDGNDEQVPASVEGGSMMDQTFSVTDGVFSHIRKKSHDIRDVILRNG